MSLSFGLIGAAGYIAPRHLKAIKDTGNVLTAAYDPNDSVGIMDSYFPDASFFTEFERFDRHVEKLRRRGKGLDYIGICSPNYLHDSHMRFALRSGAHAICEKPLVINPWNVDALEEFERDYGKRIYNILQLRHHPAIRDLRNRVAQEPADRKHDVDLTYLTSRGNWYFASWKGDIQKSGGIGTNIGVHFFDMLGWVFGRLQENHVHLHEADTAAGYLEFERARVRWFLSVNADYLPADVKAKGQRTFRSITCDEEQVEFSDGFTDLHTVSYQAILAGEGFGLSAARDSIELVHGVRTKAPDRSRGEVHPFVQRVLDKGRPSSM